MSVSNYDDVIDSRDIIERIEELTDTLELLDAEEKEELETLVALQNEAEGYSSDWKYGETLIRESYWEQYVQELCEDNGDIPKDLPSYIEIDWEVTANNIKTDYTEVDFDGITYYIRCS